MTELTFLIDLLLHDDLKPETKDKIAGRIKEVEEGLTFRPQGFGQDARFGSGFAPPPYIGPTASTLAPQSASTIAAMARNGFQEVAPVSVEAIAQTPAAAQALLARQEAINSAIGMNINSKQPGRTSPRKF